MNENESTNMRYHVLAAIRDAHWLNGNQKLFLMIVESRGTNGMYSTKERNWLDMGMSKATFYRTRQSLMDLTPAVLTAERKFNSTTKYWVDAEGLQSHSDTAESHNETSQSHVETTQSHNDEPKGNTKGNSIKVTPKVTKKGNILPVTADAAPDDPFTSIVRENFPDEDYAPAAPGVSGFPLAKIEEGAFPNSNGNVPNTERTHAQSHNETGRTERVEEEW